MDYELIDANDVFDDNNDGFIYGINWLDDNGENIVDCEWFRTEEERQEVIDKWYADNDEFTLEQ